MAQPTYPGVYVEEISSGVRPIQAAGTSTAAFLGEAERGPTGVAVKIRNISEYERNFGGYLAERFLSHAVHHFFRNGGSQCYVVRVAGDGSESAQLSLDDRSKGDEAGDPILALKAISPGTWGNRLRLRVERGTNDPDNEFRLVVMTYEGERLTPIETFDNLSSDPARPNFVEKNLRSSAVISARVNPENRNFVHGFSWAGPKDPELPVDPRRAKFRVNVDGDGSQEINLAQGVGDGEGQASDLNTIENVAVAIQYVVRRLKPLLGTTDPDAYEKFTASLQENRLTLGSGTKGIDSAVIVTPGRRDEDASGSLRLGRSNDGVEGTGNYLRSPMLTSSDEQESFVDGADGEVIAPEDDRLFIEAFATLDEVADVSLLAVPGRTTGELVQEGLAYCERRPLSDIFFLAEMPADHTTVEQARDFVASLATKNSYGAVYVPWVFASDPGGESAEPILLPPSGHIAGLYARTDAARGVWKAPAGTAATLAGVTGLARYFTDVEQGDLNPIGVDVLRRFPASGIVSWGARTIHSDPEYGYIPVRRMAILLRVSIYNGIQWAVFEPNGEELWDQLRTNITSFMMTQYRRGAFQGAQPSDAFFVKCDSETTTQDDINLGIVNVLIGFAPLKPAEFVFVKISQQAGPR